MCASHDRSTGLPEVSTCRSLKLIVVLAVLINPQVLEDRRGQIGWRDWLIGDVTASFGGRSVNLPTANATASDQCRERVRPVIATGAFGHSVLSNQANLR